MSQQSHLLGFLTVTESPRHGFIGGYLVLNTTGRPVEFHCTTPVRATRAQEILYGTTLKPFLCGEQIAVTLIQKSKNKPDFFLTDYQAIVAAEPLLDVSIAYIYPEKNDIAPMRISHRENFTEGMNSQEEFCRKNNKEMVEIREKQLEISNSSISAKDDVVKQLKLFSETIDLHEPFERIRLALEEAQRAA